MSDWASVAVCDSCWREREPGRVPARLVQRMRRRERCHYCRHDTVSGIYQRAELGSHHDS